MIECPLVTHLRPQNLTLYTRAGDILSVDGEELTPTLKTKRSVVAQHFNQTIDAMYASKDTYVLSPLMGDSSA